MYIKLIIFNIILYYIYSEHVLQLYVISLTHFPQPFSFCTGVVSFVSIETLYLANLLPLWSICKAHHLHYLAQQVGSVFYLGSYFCIADRLSSITENCIYKQSASRSTYLEFLSNSSIDCSFCISLHLNFGTIW